MAGIRERDKRQEVWNSAYWNLVPPLFHVRNMFFFVPSRPKLDLLMSRFSIAGKTAMQALEVFAIYVMPFLIVGVAIRFLMKRYAVDLPDVEKQAGPKPRRRFLLGAWRTED
jgi:hypothetical protein